MKKVVNALKNLWKDESAQGMAEYILLLVAVVTIAFIFKDRIKEIVSGRLGELSSKVEGFNVEQ